MGGLLASWTDQQTPRCSRPVDAGLVPASPVLEQVANAHQGKNKDDNAQDEPQRAQTGEHCPQGRLEGTLALDGSG